MFGFRDGEQGRSFSVQEMNLTRMEEQWGQMHDSGESPCNPDDHSSEAQLSLRTLPPS